VEGALAKLEQRYRHSQNGDGGWGYLLPEPSAPRDPQAIALSTMSTTAMTCAGLFGLATAHGAAKDLADREGRGKAVSDPGKDPNIKAAIALLAQDVAALAAAGEPRFRTTHPGRGYYILWMIERVAVAYGMKTIGGKDWYDLGASLLIKHQAPDGSWLGAYGIAGADTSFALLFLKRANLASDLSDLLPKRDLDPGQRALRTGGVGGDDLGQKLGLRSGFDPEEKSPPAAGAPTAGGEAAKLSARLLNAPAGEQEKVLEELRDSKGAVYTEALAAAIHRLDGQNKSKAREALADRLTRMTAATLADKLKDEDLEIRRAAALAVAMKEDTTHIPRLIELLEDPEPPVTRAAHAALKSLTSQDFGPAADATRAEQARAIAAWKAWWARNGKK
jgi:hypothetical protein